MRYRLIKNNWITTDIEEKNSFFFAVIFRTAIVIKWAPSSHPILKLIQTLPECSYICPSSPQVAQISANVPGHYSRFSNKHGFSDIFAFFAIQRRFYSIKRPYSESAHKTALNDVKYVRFQNNKFFDKNGQRSTWGIFH